MKEIIEPDYTHFWVNARGGKHSRVTHAYRKDSNNKRAVCGQAIEVKTREYFKLGATRNCTTCSRQIKRWLLGEK